MFDFVAKNKKFIQVFLGMIALTFAFWGVESWQRAGQMNREIATVGDQAVPQSEFQAQLRQQQERMRAVLGASFDMSQLDTPEMRQELLEGLINQRLLTSFVVREHFAVTDDQVREFIASQPPFQEDGKFSKAAYERLLMSQNMSPAMFENGLRRDMMMSQVGGALSEAGIASKALAREVARLRAQQRDVAQLLVPAEQFASQVKPDDAAVAAFYDQNKSLFQVPEQVSVEYVVLSAEALAGMEPVTAAEVKAFYDTNFGARGQERAAARKKAEGLLAELRREPGKFAELAKANSQDPGSKDNGGDLGFFSRGAMVKPFDDAVWRLREGDVSALVETEFGFHIIRVTGARKGPDGKEERRASHILVGAPQVKEFDAMRVEIEADLRRQRAAKKFAESAEAFTNLVYEQPDTLAPAAERFKLEVRKAGPFSRQSAPDKVLANPKVLTALFGDESVSKRRNIEAVEVGSGLLLSARVTDHKTASSRPLAEVRADVVKRIVARDSRELARKAGEQRLAAMQKGESASGFGTARVVSREKAEGLSREELQEAFRADAGKLPAYAGVATDRGYALLRVTRVIESEPDEPRLRATQAELSRLNGGQEFQAFVAGLRASTKVKVNKELLQEKAQ